MENKRIKTLIKYLDEYVQEIISEQEKDEKLINSIRTVNDSLKSKIENECKSNRRGKIEELIDMFEEGRYSALKEKNIKIDIELLNSKEAFIKQFNEEMFNIYSINELKLIYYAFTRDKAAYALKINKKEKLVEYVRNIIDDYRRSMRLLNRVK